MIKRIKKFLEQINFIRDNYVFLRNFPLLISKKPKEITLYVTNRCNSRCTNCFIWNQQPKIDLGIEIIKKILSDKLVGKNTSFCLQGGEFILHPNFEEILSLFKNRRFTLLSNGILANEIIAICRKYNVPLLILSLDGRPETNFKIRGVNNFSGIIKIIKNLQHSSTKVGITYTICPLNNNKDDFIFVKNLCSHYDINFGVAIYGTPFYFKCSEKEFLISSDLINHISDNVIRRYVEAYNLWRLGKYRVPCTSIRKHITVWPNGDITLCQQKEIILGNLYKNSLSEIWNNLQSENYRKTFFSCDDCWLSCHRFFDTLIFSNPAILARFFRRFIKP